MFPRQNAFIDSEDVEMRGQSKTRNNEDTFSGSNIKRSLMSQFHEIKKENKTLNNFIQFSDSDEELASEEIKAPFTKISNGSNVKDHKKSIKKFIPPPKMATRQFSFSQTPGEQTPLDNAFEGNLNENDRDKAQNGATCNRKLFDEEAENCDPN